MGNLNALQFIFGQFKLFPEDQKLAPVRFEPSISRSLNKTAKNYEYVITFKKVTVICLLTVVHLGKNSSSHMVPQTDMVIHFQHLQINQFDLKKRNVIYSKKEPCHIKINTR